MATLSRTSLLQSLVRVVTIGTQRTSSSVCRSFSILNLNAHFSPSTHQGLKGFSSKLEENMAAASGHHHHNKNGPRPRGGIAPPLEQKPRNDLLSSRTSECIGVVQMNSTDDKEKNKIEATALIQQCAENGTKMVFLPECFDYVANDNVQAAQLAEPLEGPTVTHYQKVAKDHKIWLSLGGFHEKLDSVREDGLPWMANTHIIINDEGNIVSTYRKVHLFENGGEAAQTRPGSSVELPVPTPVGKIGLGICYDVRFPEFSMSLRVQGAEILTYPSAFTVATGVAHWESLIRSRAIETQCYVIAAAQTGVHNKSGRESYGHTMVADPWGRVYPLVDRMGDATSPGCLMLEIDPSFCNEVRKNMPVFEHRRPYVYYGALPAPLSVPKDGGIYSIPPADAGNSKFHFGSMELDKKMIFIESPYSRAFVNRKCVLPGHVLVIPKRVAVRLFDLTSNETADLFELVKLVQKVMEEIHKVTSSTVSIQDGPDAGQTVKHLHIHILPRKPMDFKDNDSVYYELEKHDKLTKGDRGLKYRAQQDMLDESNAIRAHILVHYLYRMESLAAAPNYGGIDKLRWPFTSSGRKCSK